MQYFKFLAQDQSLIEEAIPISNKKQKEVYQLSRTAAKYYELLSIKNTPIASVEMRF